MELGELTAMNKGEVELLKAFRPGDEVTFQVRRYGERVPFDVKVKLQGWYER